MQNIVFVQKKIHFIQIIGNVMLSAAIEIFVYFYNFLTKFGKIHKVCGSIKKMEVFTALQALCASIIVSFKCLLSHICVIFSSTFYRVHGIQHSTQTRERYIVSRK